MRSFFVVFYTHFWDDWSTDYIEVFETENQAVYFRNNHDVEMENVEWIEGISYLIEEKTEKQLRSILSVEEYCTIFSEFKLLLDVLHSNSESNKELRKFLNVNDYSEVYPNLKLYLEDYHK